MSAVDLHPEELLDQARRGDASPEERQRLRAHLAGCPACRFENLLAEDCARAAVQGTQGGQGDSGASRARSDEDAQILARVRRGAARAVRRRVGASVVGRGRRRPTRLVYAAAGLFVFAATVAAATTAVRRAWRGPTIMPVAQTTAVARGHRHVASLTGSARSLNASEVDPALAPGGFPERSASDGTSADVEVAPTRVASPPARTARARQVSSADTPGELFARANAARRRGQLREAAGLYHELQRDFPGSSEELVSRVTLGRWMLDRLSDPAGALASFDSYLANPVHTALREEALIGRALALGRLGREREERGAWSAFLAAFPGSVYAERARGRLDALR